MNALGVKADASGFPTKGGTAPVTKFGYSDRTLDFCGGYGAVAGAGIHNPGRVQGARRLVAPRRLADWTVQLARMMFHSRAAPELTDGRPWTSAPLVLLPTLRHWKVSDPQMRK